MFKHILVPTDGSKLSLKAIDMAVKYASVSGAYVTALTVTPPYPPGIMGEGYFLESFSAPDWSKVTSQQTKRIGEIVKKRVAQLSKKSVKKLVDVKFIGTSDDNPYLAIIDAAKNRKCDLIMMASHGRGGVATLLMGSETNKVLAHSKIPVLVCR